MRERYYTFKTTDGKVEVLTLQQAFKFPDNEVKKRVHEIILSNQNRKRKKDGFEPGWQPNLNEYVGGPKEYAKILRDKGLVEIGYDYVPTESVGEHNFCQTEEFIQACVESGIELNGNEQDAIKSGEYFKDIQLEV
jgi:hypothetical protein